MPTLNIEGRKVKVDDSFLSMSPEEQNKAVEEIAESLKITPQGGEVMGRDMPHTAGQTMESYEPGFMERMGNATFDTLKSLGLPAERMRRDVTNLDNTVRGVADSLSVGTSDEITAWMNSVLGGDYEGELKQQRAIDEAGGTYRTAGQVMGAVGGGAGLIRRGLSPAYNTAKAGAGWLPVLGTSAGEGMALGSLYGFGSGQGGFENRKNEALRSGAVGLAIGTAAPVATRTLGALGDMIAAPFRSRGTKAEKLLSKSMRQDGLTGTEASARLHEMGPEAMPIDLGANIRQQAEGLAAMPGNAQSVVRGALDERAAGASQRVVDATNEALGQPVNTLAMADDIIARRSAAAKPLYEHAYSQPVPYTRELEALLKRPATAQALRKARALAANEGIPSQQWFANVADDGAVTIGRVPDVRQLDLTKRALDDMIGTAKRAGNSNEARILTGLKNDLVGMVDSAVPSYARARNAYSGPTLVLEAMEEGQSLFRNPVTPAQVERTLAGMGASEREAFQQGARAAIADIMGTARNDANAARALFEKGYNREKLAMLVGEDNAAALINRLGHERTFMDTRNSVLGNTATPRRAEVMRELGGEVNDHGLLRNMMNMRFGDAAASMVRPVTRPFRQPGIESRNEMLARLITERSGKGGFEKTVERMDMKAISDAHRKALVDAMLRHATPAANR